MKVIDVEVIKYDGNTNDLICRFPNAAPHCVDPFVGGVVEQTEENAFDVGKSMEGKRYRMIGGVYHRGAYLPESFEEIDGDHNV